MSGIEVTSSVGPASVTRATLTPESRDPWLPTGAIAQNQPYGICNLATLTLLSTGRLGVVGGITLPAGVPVASITFVSGSTALSVGSNQWFALYNVSTRALLRQTADDTSTAWAANTAKTLTLTSTYTPTSDERVWVGINVTATTVPTLAGSAGISAGTLTVLPLAAGVSNTGLTGTAPNPCNAPTAFGTYPYCYVS